MAKTARVYLIRHGETDANVQKIIQGHLDTQLNATGKRQAQIVGETLRSVRFVAAFTSDLSRARETACAIILHHPEVKLVQQEKLRERFMGEYEGIVWPPSEGLVAHSAETPAAVAERSINWWKNTILRAVAMLPEPLDGGARPACVLAVSHGGFLRALAQALVGARHASYAEGVEVGGRIPNTGICEVEVVGRKGIIWRYGDATHLTISEEETKGKTSQLALPAEQSNADADLV